VILVSPLTTILTSPATKAVCERLPSAPGPAPQQLTTTSKRAPVMMQTPSPATRIRSAPTAS